MNALRPLELTGSPRQMGHQHGEAHRDAVARLADDRLRRCIDKAHAAGRRVTADDVLRFCDALVVRQAADLPIVHEEFTAIAEAANVSPARLMIANGYTDVVDAMSYGRAANAGGCTACLVAAEATAEGRPLLAQTWDMHPTAREHVIAVLRRPDAGPATLGVTTTGCLSLIGLNAAGLAIGNNNLKATDARIGLIYLALIHEALRQTLLAAAVNAIARAHRLSGHNYLLVGPDGEIVDVETTATAYEVADPTGGFYVHTNHYLAEALREHELADADHASSAARWSRMTRLLHEQAGSITPASLRTILADEAGAGACRICRRDPADEQATCAAVVLSPHTRTLWLAAGPPADTPFVELRLP